MNKSDTAVAVYDSHEQAEAAVRELAKAGFDMKTISIVGKDYHSEEHVVGYFNAGDRAKFFGKLKRAKKPMIIVGQGALARGDGRGVLASIASLAYAVGAIKDGWNGLGILHAAAARVGGLDVGFVPGPNGVDAATQVVTMDVLFLLGADEIDLTKKGANLTVYIGSHGDHGASNADVILPGAAYTEKSSIFVNTEGRVQVAQRATFAPGDAREDWAIIRALSETLGKRLAFDSLAQLRARLFAAHPHLADTDEILAGNADEIAAVAKKARKMNKSGFASPVKDFYLTNPIARASAVMAECSQLARNNFKAAAE